MPKPPNSRQLIGKFFDGMFAAGESASDLISEYFLDSTSENKVEGRTPFLNQCRQLNKDYRVLHRSRAWGRGTVISEVWIYDRSLSADFTNLTASGSWPPPSEPPPLSRQFWSWTIENGKITGRSVMHTPRAHYFLKKWFATFRLLRAAIIVDILFGCGVLCPQGLEILRMMAGAPGDKIPYSLLLDSPSWSLYLTIAIAAFCVLRIAMAAMHPISLGSRGIPRFWAPEIDGRLLGPPLLLAAVPSFVLGIALWISSYDVAESQIVLHIRFWAMIQLAIACPCLFLSILISIKGKGLLPGKELRVGAGSLLAIMFLISVVSLWAPSVGGWGTTPAVLALRLNLLLALLGLCAWLGDISRLPVLILASFWFVVLALLGWDDHHTIDTLPSSARPYIANFGPTAIGPVASVFSKWLEARHDSTSQHFSTVIVSTEGGGIRAAVMTARVLYELSSRYPTFRHHLFAIVGVSGGSLGAAAYAASVHDPGKGNWQKAFDSDMLSPSIRSLMGVDFLSRFVPRWLWDLSPYDRAHALEAAWTGNWQRETGSNIRQLYFGNLRPSPYSDKPALVLLTTSTKTGERMAISHLTFPAPSLKKNATSPIRTLADELPWEDVPLATAAFMSARFPLVSPPARLPGPGEAKRYVDGGYYENSGVSTVLDIVRALRSEAAGRANILVIRIENGEVQEKKDKVQWFPLIDLRQPFDAFYRAGNAHGEAAIRQLHDEIDRSNACHSQPTCVEIREAVFQLGPTRTPLPLGWFISAAARNEIARQVWHENTDGFVKVEEALR